MKKHKKHNIGQNHPRAKFTDKMVLRIRELHEQGQTITQLSKFYGTTYNYMYKLVNYYYKHLE